MPRTLSVIKAGVGGFVGRSAVHPEVLEAARSSLARALEGAESTEDGGLTDAQAHAVGDDLALVLSHDRGEAAEDVHRIAWDALTAAAGVAGNLHLYAAGQDLLADAFSGNLSGAGPSVAEVTFNQRPSEPVVVLLADKTRTGALNLPLARAFADPFNTPGLVLAEALHGGFAFEVHDLLERRKIMFTTPEEAYDLLAFIGMPSRFAVKRVVSRDTGDVAAVASTDSLAHAAGSHAGNDDPVAIVRCHGAFPALGELLEPFTTPALVEGGLRASHAGPLAPVSVEGSTTGRFDGPRVVALGYQVAAGRLVGPRDLFVGEAFEGARREAAQVTDYLRRHGAFEPHRLPLDETEQASMPAVAAKMANRWSEL